jgi:hypothetical protein
MGDTLTVSMDTSKDVAEPTLEESAAKIDEQFPPPVEDRPEWLPEKFKSAEDLAKAYSELEKKLGSKKPLDAPVEEKAKADDEAEPKTTEVEDQAREAVENAGLNFDEMSNRYWESGELPEADYKALEKAGIPKQLVDQFIAGQEAMLNATRQSVFSTVGGEEAYFNMTDWAADNMSKEEVLAYNKAVNSGDMNMAMMAVKGLQARFSAEVGYEPQRQVTGGNAKSTDAVYRSLAELQKDMADPRYQKDPAFRKDVENKLSRSDIM